MNTVDLFGRQYKKLESNVKVLSNGGLSSINDSLSVKVDPNVNNLLSLSANGLMANGIKLNERGEINMKNNKLINVKNPVDSQDAATKDYVNAQVKLKVNKTGDKMFGKLDMNFNTI